VTTDRERLDHGLARAAVELGKLDGGVAAEALVGVDELARLEVLFPARLEGLCPLLKQAPRLELDVAVDAAGLPAGGEELDVGGGAALAGGFGKEGKEGGAAVLEEDVDEVEGEELDVGVGVGEALEEGLEGVSGRDGGGAEVVGEGEGVGEVEGGRGGEEVRGGLLYGREEGKRGGQWEWQGEGGVTRWGGW